MYYECQIQIIGPILLKFTLRHMINYVLNIALSSVCRDDLTKIKIGVLGYLSRAYNWILKLLFVIKAVFKFA